MFKNRELRVQVAKTNSKPTDSADQRDRTGEILLIHSIIKDDVKKIAMIAGAGYTLKRVFDLGSEIAVIAAKANIK
jgi:hypothetical protein